ncbi:hypothetical protein QTN25_005552 [Entamoeba marina]
MKTLYVSDVDASIPETKLKEVFEQHGVVSNATIKKSHKGSNDFFYAFVEYEKEAEAEEAQKRMDGYELAGRKLVVRFAKPKKPRDDYANHFPRRDFDRDLSYSRDDFRDRGDDPRGRSTEFRGRSDDFVGRSDDFRGRSDDFGGRRDDFGGRRDDFRDRERNVDFRSREGDTFRSRGGDDLRERRELPPPRERFNDSADIYDRYNKGPRDRYDGGRFPEKVIHGDDRTDDRYRKGERDEPFDRYRNEPLDRDERFDRYGRNEPFDRDERFDRYGRNEPFERRNERFEGRGPADRYNARDNVRDNRYGDRFERYPEERTRREDPPYRPREEQLPVKDRYAAERDRTSI